MTKEMRPSHRVDILTHALLHYGFKTKEKLGLFPSLVCSTMYIRMYVYVCMDVMYVDLHVSPYLLYS